MRQINYFKANIDIQLALLDQNYAWLARQMGITPQSVRGVLLHGKPTPATIRKCAEALGVGPQELTRDVTYGRYGEAMIPRMKK